MLSDFIIIGDPHLTHKSMDKMTELCAQVESAGLPTIWLGDLLDTKEVIRGKCLSFWIDYFSKSKLKHFVIVGNHDWFNLDCQGHSLAALKLISNVEVIDKPTRFVNLPFLMIPYIHDKEQLAKVLSDGTKEDVLICHIEAKDFDYGNGYVCDSGVTLSELKNFKRVISGHFHAYQAKENLVYLGTPFSNSFGEANQKKYLGRYNVQTDSFTISETAFPKHISIEFNCDLLDDRGSHMFLNTDDPLWTKHYYRIILTGKQENIERFPKHIYEQGGSEGKLDIRFISRPSASDASVSIDETSSNEAQFSTWAKNIKNLDDETVKLGLQIMEAVR